MLLVKVDGVRQRGGLCVSDVCRGIRAALARLSTVAIQTALAGGVLLAALPARSEVTVAGFTPGSFRVTESGSAEYRIPLRVPPGIAGMEPRLALAYSSQTGNGLLGMGWNVEGLSAIGRCPKTVAQDGIRGTVRFDANDVFCLDGQRLFAINGGAYGADGTEYRTERESFSKVVSYGGAAGSGPTSFRVWTKSGQLMEYGNTPDSRVDARSKTALPGTVRLWALNKVSDTKGNYFTVSYQNNLNGEFYPTRFDYTGNDVTGSTPFASVQLIYAARPDPIYTNIAGSPIRNTVRINRLRTYIGETTVTEYRLAYEQGAASGRSRLQSVAECRGDGSVCLPATAFTWQEPVLGAQNWGWGGGHGLGAGGWVLANLFGDGRQVYYTKQGNDLHHATRLNADGTFTNWTWAGGHGIGAAGWKMGDLFGDGHEVYYTNQANGLHHATRLNVDGTLTNWTWTGGHGVGAGGWMLIDLFGDGRQLYYTKQGNDLHHATRLNTDGTVQNWTWSGGHGIGASGWRFADLFGDGRPLYYTNQANGDHHATRLNEDGTVQNYSWTGGQGVGAGGWRLVDLFGDGRQVYYTNQANGDHYASRLNPDGTVENFFWTGANGVGAGGWDFVNLLGDGRQIYYTHQSNGTHYASRLNPDGTFTNWTWSGGSGLGAGGWRVGDLFGDGRLVYHTHQSNGDHYATRFSSSPADLLLTITNGTGATTTIAYKPLTDSTVYAKDNDAAYPRVDLQVPMQVVDSTTTDNGVGGTAGTSHAYGGLKAELGTGRGLLGFRLVDTVDTQTGLRSRAEFRQDWPYVGQASSATRTQGSGAVLSQVLNTYACKDPTSEDACRVSAGNRYFPHISQAVQTSNDLSGTPLPTVTTTTQYDNYGNVTSVVISTDDGYSKTTTNSYSNDPSKWLLGRLIRSSVQSKTP